MRASPLIEYSSTVLILCLWVGAITTVFSSLVGLFQQDIKKVIAYSTMSQLGMMVIAVGLSSYNIALFHLINHAFYKALLFLGAGAVIHAVADNQDFRKYGGLIFYLPLTYSVMLIASLSLVAIPFMTGFYSKDLILESAYGHYHLSSIIVYFIATIGAMFTTLYSVKVLYLTFLSNPNGPLVNYKQPEAAHEGDIFMSIPLIILAVFSIFFGYLTKDIFIGLASGFFSDNSLFIHPLHEIMLNTEFAVPTLFKLLPLFFTISLSLISLLFTEFYPKLLVRFKFSNFGYNIFGFFNQRFFVELFYNKYICGIILKLGGQTTKVMDKGLVELIGPYGLERNLTNLSRSINKLNTGVVTYYALYILMGLIFYFYIFYSSYFSKNFLDLFLLFLFGLICLTNMILFNSLKSAFSKIFKSLNPTYIVFSKEIWKKFFSKKTFFKLTVYNIFGITVRYITIYMGFYLRIKNFFLYLIILNLIFLIVTYINIVIDYNYKDSEIQIEKPWYNIFRGITRKKLLKLLVKIFITLAIKANFLHLDIDIINFDSQFPIGCKDFCPTGSHKITLPTYIDPNYYKQDYALVYMQENLGGISVRNNDLHSFNGKLDITIPNNILPYYLLSQEEQTFHLNNLLCIESREKAHIYTIRAIVKTNGNLERITTARPDVRVFEDLPKGVKNNLSEVMNLSSSFTGTQTTVIRNDLPISDIRRQLDNIKLDCDKPHKSLETTLRRYKKDLAGGSSIADRAYKEYKASVVDRAKYLRNSK